MESIVSVIIPHFNRSELLKETIASVKKQTFTKWEVIIVDDGSNESEIQKIKKFENSSNIRLFHRNYEVKGPSSCRNIGAKKAIGIYLVFLDSDDLLAPFCLEQRIQFMSQNNHLDLAVFKMDLFSSDIKYANKVYNSDVPVDDWVGAFLRNQNPWNVTCPIWKRSFFNKIGGFDEDLLYMEDPYIHLKAILYPGANIETCYDLPSDSYYRINNIDSSKKHFDYNSIYYRIKFYAKLCDVLQPKVIEINSSNIRIGIYRFVKTFLYARGNLYPQLVDKLLGLMKRCKLFSGFEIAVIRFLIKVGNYDTPIFKLLKVRGIFYKLLPQK